jgi:Flp pilus assembly protein TadD
VRALVLCFLLWADPGYDQVLRDGLSALRGDRIPEARTNLERAVKLNPNGGEAWAALAQVYYKLNFALSARNASAKAEALGAKDPATMRALIDYYTIAGDKSRAADYAERYAIAIGPRDADAILRAIELRIDAKQAKLAIALAQKTLAKGDRAPLRALLARAYEADGDTPHAINEYNRAILLDSYDESNYFELSQLLLEKENFTTAAQVLEAGRKIFDKSPEIELALGTAYYGLKKYDEAGFAFLKAATLAPQSPQAYMLLGRILDQNTRWLPEITTAFATFAQAQPRQYLPQFLYGKALLAGGQDLAGAEACLRKSIALEDRFWESHYQLGIVLEKQKKLIEAAAELHKCTSITPNDSRPHQELARVFDLLGKPADAKAERDTAQKLAAESRPAAPKPPVAKKRPHQ